MLSKIAVNLVVAGLMTIAYASAGTITDITQIPNSNLGIYGVIVGTGLGTGAQTANPSNAFLGISTSPIGTSSVPTNVSFGFNANSADIQLSSDDIIGNVGTSGTSANCASNGACYGGTLTGLLNSGTGVNGTTGAGAISDATSLAAAYLAYGNLTTSLPRISDGTTTLNVSSTPGFHPGGNVNEDVYFVDATYASNLAITLTASQYVVIDLGSGNGTLSSAGANLFGITLTGLNGVADPYDHVLIDVDTTGVLHDSTARNGVINADVIDAYGQVAIDVTTLNGRLYCTLEPGSCDIVHGTNLSAAVNTQQQSPVPEPSTFLLVAPCLLMGLAFRRFRAVR